MSLEYLQLCMYVHGESFEMLHPLGV